MKRFALLSLLVAAALARADVAETQIKSAFTDLRSHPTFCITLNGVDDFDGKQKQLQTRLWWFTTTDAKGETLRKLECCEWVDGTLTTRTVGDGTTMWSLDVARNRYTVATYGSFGTTKPATYLRALVMAFNSGATGPTQFVARLLTDMYGGTEVQYTPWLKSNVSGEYTDVLVDTGYVSYRFGNPIYKWMRYTLWPDGYGEYRLTSFDLHDETKVGGKNRIVSWLASVDTVTEPAAASFVFTPPAGSHPLVKSRTGAK